MGLKRNGAKLKTILVCLLSALSLLWVVSNMRKMIGYFSAFTGPCGAVGAPLTYEMGLGNELFVYATVYGISQESGRVPYVISNGATRIEQLFALNLNISTVRSWRAPRFHRTIHEERTCAEDPRISNITCNATENVEVCCYLQSWKYFEAELDELIQRLKHFLPWIEKECQKGLDEEKRAFGVPSHKLLLYGIHVRMFDELPEGPKNMAYGHPRDNKTFLALAIDHLTRLATKQGKTAKFLAIAPNRTRLGSEFFPRKNGDVHVAQNRPWQVDFCMLTRLDGLIFGGGSFAWWAAAINGKTVIRQREFCNPETFHCTQFKEHGDDHFLDDKWLYL